MDKRKSRTGSPSASVRPAIVSYRAMISFFTISASVSAKETSGRFFNSIESHLDSWL